MERLWSLLFFLLILFTISAGTVSAYAMHCAGGVITTGDRSSDVLAKCGQPNFRESHQEEVSMRANASMKEKQFITVDEWTYDFGSDRLIQIITIKNGIVTNIQETHYGISNSLR
jgi:hypothetical protein